MKHRNAVATSLVLAGALASCQMPTALRGSEPWPFGGEERQPAEWQSQGPYRRAYGVDPERRREPISDEPPPLLAWDGGVVEGNRQGVVNEDPAQSHGLEPTVEGRMHIIELYQDVLDERDSLVREVEMLGTTLDKTQDLLERSLRERSELEARIAEMESGRDELTEENRELTARLTTAQIRRLEAEKLLLENRIAWHRQNEGPRALPFGAPVAGGSQ